MSATDDNTYPRPSVAADVVIFAFSGAGGAPEILLIKRGGEPFKGRWALPGGFMNPDETVGRAAARELMEETGVDGIPLEQVFTFTQPGRDPRSWVISCAHMAVIDKESVRPRPADDAADA
ncbi:MAG: NUDIX hydrolase, partial [Methylobacteriaceae bacterium]|nr:NUDIX hydrolase [Methylobacteriaceae bacterium]